jgi:hypothetical protein
MGTKQKSTIRREMAAQRAADLMAKQVDTVHALDALAVMQEAMAHFYYKAKVLKTMGVDAPFEQIDEAMEKAARWAKEICAFKYAKIQAQRLASDPNPPVLPEHMTLDELRESIVADIERLREVGVLTLPAIKQEANGNGKEPEAEDVVPREEK